MSCFPNRVLLILSFLAVATKAESAFTTDDAEAYYISKETTLSIDLINSKLAISESTTEKKMFIKSFEKHSHESIYYSDFDPVVELEAFTMVPNEKNNKYKEYDVVTIETKDIVQPGIFYGGYKRKDFAYPMLQKNAIAQVTYKKKIMDPHMLSPFYFVENIPVKMARYSLLVDKSVKVDWKIFGDNIDQIAMNKTDIGNKWKYEWVCANLDRYNHEKQAPSRSYFAPHIVVYIKSYTVGGLEHTVLQDVSSLYGWYSKLVRSQDEDTGISVLQGVVNNLVANLKTDEEKAETIFNWVQSNIKYVAFEDGMAGFVPRKASDVYNKKYGDCKDMANLLKTMLNMAGLNAYLTWIGTRDKPYSYHDLPSTVTDNHMICALKQRDDYLFLDATGSYTSFGMPSSMIQGKEALIGLKENDFDIVKVPVIEKELNVQFDSIFIAVSGSELKGTINAYFEGYARENFIYEKLKAKITNDSEYVRDYFGIGTNNIKIYNEVYHGFDDQEDNAVVSFDFDIPDYCRVVADKIYLNMNLVKKSMGDKVLLEGRTKPLQEDYKYQKREVVALTVPDGFSVSYVPEDQVITYPFFGLSIKYELMGSVITLEKTYSSDFLLLQKESFEDWNKFLDHITSIGQESVVLSKIN